MDTNELTKLVRQRVAAVAAEKALANIEYEKSMDMIHKAATMESSTPLSTTVDEHGVVREVHKWGERISTASFKK